MDVIEQFGLQVKDDDQELSPTALGRGEPPDSGKGPIGPVTTLAPIPIEELREGEARRRGESA